MVGLDTNVLLRYFFNSNDTQTKVVVEYIEKNCSVEEPGFISSVVLSELTWVLKSNYKLDKDVVIKLISKILYCNELFVENQECAIQALKAYEKGGADFSDYFIAHIAKHYKAKTTVTFDKKAGKYKLFELL